MTKVLEKAKTFEEYLGHLAYMAMISTDVLQHPDNLFIVMFSYGPGKYIMRNAE
jgi:hypothetical protein